MIAWREALDLVCRTRGTCLRWFSFASDGMCFGGQCVRGCAGADCQWLTRPTLRRHARGTSPPAERLRTEPHVRFEPAEQVATHVVAVEPLPLPDPPSGPVRVR